MCWVELTFDGEQAFVPHFFTPPHFVLKITTVFIAPLTFTLSHSGVDTEGFSWQIFQFNKSLTQGRKG